MTKAFTVLIHEETDEHGKTRLQVAVRDQEATDPTDFRTFQSPKFQRGLIPDRQRAAMYGELFLAMARVIHEGSFPDDERYFPSPKKPVNGNRIILTN